MFKIKEEHQYIAFCIAILLAFFLQHYLFLSWDFSAYKLNGDYLLGKGSYFEWYRPPVVPIFLGLLGFFGKFGEYLFIALTGIIFFYSIYRLSRPLEIPAICLLSAFLIPTFFINAATAGSELLGISFVLLFVAGLLEKKNYGFFLGLAFLTRYQYLYLLPLLLAYKKPGKIALNFLYFIIPSIPWFIFNYIVKGNAFASIFDGFLMNIKYRDYMVGSFSLIEFIKPFIFILPFAIPGIYYSFKDKHKWIFYFISAIFIYVYISTPLKIERYLFSMLIPLSYFFILPVKRIEKKEIFCLIFSSFFILVAFAIVLSQLVNPLSAHRSAILELENNNLSNYTIYSDSWVYLNYLNVRAYPPPYQLADHLNNSVFIHLVGYEEGDLRLDRYANVIYRKSFTIYYGDNPAQEYYPLDYTYLERLNIETNHNETYCGSVFGFSLMQQACKIFQR